VKRLEIAIMALAAWGFFSANMPILLGCTFLMGLHSTLFGPVKFAYLPHHLSERELTGGNGMVEMGTFVAILLGNVAGGLHCRARDRRMTTWALPVWALAVLGRVVSHYIPASPATDPGLTINWNPFTETVRNLKLAHQQRGGVPLAAGHQLDVVLWRGVSEPVPQLCQGGAAWQRAGGVAAAGGVFHRHWHGFAAVRGDEPPPCGDWPGAAGRHRHECVCDRPVLCVARPATPQAIFTLAQFVAVPGHWRVMADLALLSLFAGLYSVPMYALIQLRSAAHAPRPHHRGQQHPERAVHDCQQR
jgi:MFS family permease